MSLELLEPVADRETPPAQVVILADGSRRSLEGLDVDQLQRLQFEQERAYAERILASPRRSPHRADITKQCYDTVTTILAAVVGKLGQPLVMGLDRRHEQLVLRLLARQRAAGLTPRLFEIGFGCGALLKRVAEQGYDVAGIEVSPVMRDQALAGVPARFHDQLWLGSLLHVDESGAASGRFTLAYWNDVLEHIPPDELADYLARIYSLLAPGGQLVTITPNWHVRPMDITGEYFPPRTTAQGVHLKEYTLREVTALLRGAGFRHVATPLVVTPRRVVLAGQGLAGWKRRLEPALEHLPFRLTNLLVRGAGLAWTVATK